MKKIIITGANGQIGSYMVDFLLKKNRYEIVALVTEDYFNSVINKTENLRLVVADITHHRSMLELIKIEEPDYFLNFAGKSFVPNSWEDPISTFETNTNAVLNILEAIRKHAPLCRFFNACSAEIFGSSNGEDQNEKTPTNPKSLYAVSKNASKDITRIYRETQNIYAVSGILFNQESPRRGKEFVSRKITSNVARISHAIKRGEKFEPFYLGNVDARRDFSAVEDVCEGIWKIVNQEVFRYDLQPELYRGGEMDGILTKPLKDYILASGNFVSIRQFVELTFAIAGIEGVWVGNGVHEKFILPNYLKDFAEINSIDLVRINPDFYRKAEINSLVGDPHQARHDLHWFPKISFVEMVQNMFWADFTEQKT